MQILLQNCIFSFAFVFFYQIVSVAGKCVNWCDLFWHVLSQEMLFVRLARVRDERLSAGQCGGSFEVLGSGRKLTPYYGGREVNWCPGRHPAIAEQYSFSSSELLLSRQSLFFVSFDWSFFGSRSYGTVAKVFRKKKSKNEIRLFSCFLKYNQLYFVA